MLFEQVSTLHKTSMSSIVNFLRQFFWNKEFRKDIMELWSRESQSLMVGVYHSFVIMVF